jgi:cytochrome P450
VFKTLQFHRPLVCITDLRLGWQVLDWQRARLCDPRQPFGRETPSQALRFLANESDPRHRAILRDVLTPGVIHGNRHNVAQLIQQELERVAAPGIDPRPALERLTITSMCHVMFGTADVRLASMLRAQKLPRIAEQDAALSPIVDAIKETSRPLPGGFSALDAIAGIDSRQLEDRTLIGNLVVLVLATRSNVNGTLSWMVKELLEHPSAIDELRRADSAQAQAAMARHVVLETLRLHQSEFFYRETIEEIPAGPYVVPRRWLIRVCVREAHDNSAVFPEPLEFRPARFDGRTWDRTEFCPFSDAANSAFGADLALMIAEAFAITLARHWEGRITSDGPPERPRNRHWSHWAPSQRLRIDLRPRGTGEA